MGRQGIAEMIGRCCDWARELSIRIGELPGAELVWEPTLNQGLVRFLDPSPNATPEDHDRHTDKVIAAIQRDGGAFFGGSTWRGRRAMRISVCNWQTSASHVEASVAACARVLEETRS